MKKNKGKPGIDGVTLADFEARLDEELSRLQQELINWTYQPAPVRRVEIPKPQGGVRLLGITTVRDDQKLAHWFDVTHWVYLT